MRRSNTCGCGVGDEARREETISRREAPWRRDMRRRRDWHSEARPAAAAAVAAAARVAVEGLAPIPPRSAARLPANDLVASAAVGRRERRRGIAISDGDGGGLSCAFEFWKWLEVS
jgi:pyruvate/2-oxoglutarate dehydrogenase complex dihydrolipoamide acyltransferase (E2) component